MHIPKIKRQKLDTKSAVGQFIGYAEKSKGFRIWFPDTKKVEIARDVFFTGYFPKTAAEKHENNVFDLLYSPFEQK